MERICESSLRARVPLGFVEEHHELVRGHFPFAEFAACASISGGTSFSNPVPPSGSRTNRFVMGVVR